MQLIFIYRVSINWNRETGSFLLPKIQAERRNMKVNGQLREVVTISCCYGTGGIFDADTRERIETW